MRYFLASLCLWLAATGAAHADRDSALAAVRTDGPTVQDATWMPNGWMAVGVVNNSGDRSGLAEYLCGVLADHGVTRTHVKIVDIVALRRNNDWTGIGLAECR